MTINKLSLAFSVATLLGAVSPVLADDATTALTGRDDQSGYTTLGSSRTGQDFEVMQTGPLFYTEQPAYRAVPSPFQNPDVLPQPTVPLGSVGEPPDVTNDSSAK